MKSVQVVTAIKKKVYLFSDCTVVKIRQIFGKMKTVTIDIINDRAMKLLQELEFLQLIRLRKEKTDSITVNWAERYKGAMSKQPLTEVNSQLDELRGEWE